GVRELVVRKLRDHNALGVGSDPVPVHIFYYDIQFVPTGLQRNRLPVDLVIFRLAREQLRWNIGGNGVLEGLSHPYGDAGQASKNVHDTMLYAIFVSVGDI